MPILLMLVFAIISYGFLFAQDLALGNAARQTARYGAVENRTCDEVKAEALAAAAPLVNLNQTGSVIEIKRGTRGCYEDDDLRSRHRPAMQGLGGQREHLRHLEVPGQRPDLRDPGHGLDEATRW